MKIKLSQLKRIIKEEVKNLREVSSRDASNLLRAKGDLDRVIVNLETIEWKGLEAGGSYGSVSPVRKMIKTLYAVYEDIDTLVRKLEDT